MTSHQFTRHLQQRLARLEAAQADVAELERQLGAARDRRDDQAAELHGLVPIAELVAVTQLTRQHLHRLARRNRTGGAK